MRRPSMGTKNRRRSDPRRLGPRGTRLGLRRRKRQGRRSWSERIICKRFHDGICSEDNILAPFKCSERNLDLGSTELKKSSWNDKAKGDIMWAKGFHIVHTAHFHSPPVIFDGFLHPGSALFPSDSAIDRSSSEIIDAKSVMIRNHIYSFLPYLP